MAVYPKDLSGKSAQVNDVNCCSMLFKTVSK